MSQLNICIDDDMKKKAEALFEELGIDMATAVNLFIRQAVRQGGIPFEVTTDPFYDKTNMEVLNASIKEAEAGKVTAHEVDRGLADEKPWTDQGWNDYIYWQSQEGLTIVERDNFSGLGKPEPLKGDGPRLMMPMFSSLNKGSISRSSSRNKRLWWP